MVRVFTPPPGSNNKNDGLAVIAAGGISAELPIAASRGGVQGDIRGMLSCIASSSTNMAIENPPFLIGETHLQGWSIFQPC